MPSLGMETLRD